MKFEILGEPKAKGRPRFRNYGKFVSTYTPKETYNYENLVKLAYQNTTSDKFDKQDMLYASITAYFKIPASTSKKKREEMILGRIRPIKKPDLDNVAKIILDSLNSIAYYDDSQIVSLYVKKYYSENPRVLVVLQKVEKLLPFEEE